MGRSGGHFERNDSPGRETGEDEGARTAHLDGRRAMRVIPSGLEPPACPPGGGFVDAVRPAAPAAPDAANPIRRIIVTGVRAAR